VAEKTITIRLGALPIKFSASAELCAEGKSSLNREVLIEYSRENDGSLVARRISPAK